MALEDTNHSNDGEKDIAVFYKTNNPSLAHSAEQAFNRLEQRINSENKMELMRKKLILWRYSAIAAGVALLVSCYFMFNKPTQMSEMKILCTTAGQSQQFVLPDGTNVWVNADSRILYPEKFNKKNREVYLSGEAYFEVTKNKDCPFIVKTDKLNVKVFGTKFNVRSYPDEPNIETTLVEGLVSVASEEVQLSETMLLPNQQLVLRKVDGKVALYDDINLKYHTGWLNGRLYFKRASIEDITRKLERVFNVKIHVESQKLRERKFTGRFDYQESIDDILNAIQLTTKCTYYRQGNSIVMRD